MIERRRGNGVCLFSLVVLSACSGDPGRRTAMDTSAGESGAAGQAPSTSGGSMAQPGAAGQGGAGEGGAGEGGSGAQAGASAGEGGAGGGAETACAPVPLGPKGGTVLGPDGTRLSIPKGAVDTETAFCIFDDTLNAPKRDEFAVGSAYAIVPHGTQFADPAAVRLPVTAGSAHESSSHDPDVAGSPLRVVAAEADGKWHDVDGASLTSEGGRDFIEVAASGLSHWSVGCAWKTTYTPVLRVFTSATPELITEVEPINGEYPVSDGDIVHVVLEASYHTQFNPSYFPGHAPLDGIATAIDDWSLLQTWGQEAANMMLPPLDDAAPGAGRVLVPADTGLDGGTIAAQLDWNNDGAPERACFAYRGVGEALAIKLRVLDSKRMSIAAGGSVSFAIATDGKVYGWGANTAGSLGNGDTNQVDSPVEIPALFGAKQISTRGDHSIALMGDGRVLTWGDNTYRQVTDSATTPQPTPVAVAGLSNVRSVSAGFYNSFALLADGTVAIWGISLGSPGAAFDWSVRPTLPAPTIVPGLEHCVSIQGSGLNYATALTADGRVWTWGSDLDGELGDGHRTLDKPADYQLYDRALPAVVSLPVTARSVAAGALGSYVVGWDGTLTTWGSEFNDLLEGQQPIQLLGMSTAVAAVAAGTRQLFLANDGGLWQWSRSSVEAPTEMSLGNAVQIAVSVDHSMALDKDGKVYTWGEDDKGQLGDGPDVRVDLETPAALPSLDLDGP
jgi:alpha-tubulin suppressor-like RCC1 family protein